MNTVSCTDFTKNIERLQSAFHKKIKTQNYNLNYKSIPLKEHPRVGSFKYMLYFGLPIFMKRGSQPL